MKHIILTLIFMFSLCSVAFGADYIVTLKDNVEISNKELEPILEEKNIYLCNKDEAEKLYSEGAVLSISKDEPLVMPDFGNSEDFNAEPSLIPMAAGYNDPYYSNEIYYEQMSIMNYIDTYSPTGDVRIAVIDTGVNRDHVDFASSKIETGYNFITNSTDTADLYRHGTMVTSLICAAANDGVGVAGIAPNATIVPLVALTKIDGENKGTTSTLIKAIRAAAEQYDCKIITTSLGVKTNSTAMEEAVDYALSKGIIVISAAGNSGDNADPTIASELSYPASYNGVISVGATDLSYNRATYSQKNTEVDVVAFGGNLTMPSNININQYVSLKGTSFSTPVIAGITALFVSMHPDITPEEYAYVIKASAKDIGVLGASDFMGYGMPDCMEMEKAYSSLNNGDVYVSPFYTYISDNNKIVANAKISSFNNVKKAQLVTVYNEYSPFYKIIDLSFEDGFAWTLVENIQEKGIRCFVIEDIDNLKSLSDVRIN